MYDLKELRTGDEAQLQEISPVVGLLEAQQQPDQQQQQTAAEQYGSLGFFGSLCSAPPVNTPGAHPILHAPPPTSMLLLHACTCLLLPLSCAFSFLLRAYACLPFSCNMLG